MSMKSSFKNGLEYVYLCLKILTLLSIIIFIITLDFKETFDFKLFKNNLDLDSILSTLHNEGTLDININYNDPNIQKRKIIMMRDTDDREAERVIKILSYLDTLAPRKPITIYIDSNGGYSGYTIANFFRIMKSKVNVYALDWCASSCAIILAGATGKRYALKSSRISIHILERENSSVDDTKYDHISMNQRVKKMFWKKYTKLPKEFYSRNKETLYRFTGKEAKKYGLVDSLL